MTAITTRHVPFSFVMCAMLLKALDVELLSSCAALCAIWEDINERNKLLHCAYKLQYFEYCCAKWHSYVEEQFPFLIFYSRQEHTCNFHGFFPLGVEILSHFLNLHSKFVSDNRDVMTLKCMTAITARHVPFSFVIYAMLLKALDVELLCSGAAVLYCGHMK